MEDKITTIHPQGKKGVNLSKEKQSLNHLEKEIINKDKRFLFHVIASSPGRGINRGGSA